ncbi:hypothetical protein MKX01_040401 [Papaver californicum]|nr:hypothetical protein MKX01_040401 [Papaver californicum]
MGFVSSLLGILGFGFGFPVGILIGYFLFIYYQSKDVKEPVFRPIHEPDTNALLELLNELPLWVKNPDYDRVDWLNRFLSDMWPYLDKGICATVRSTVEPMFSEYIGKYMIKSIGFECIKVYETNEKELVAEPVIRWAGKSQYYLGVESFLVDLQIFATPRISLKPLVPTFPFFSNIEVSLMEKPHVDFGLKLLGYDLMAIPGLYRYVQETIRKQVANLYLWPQTLEIPILDSSVGATRKPVGILHVKIVKAVKLLKMDFLGTSDPYVVLSLSGERLPGKKTTVKMKNLNPEWNEDFKLIVKDLETQVLELHVNDWDKVELLVCYLIYLTSPTSNVKSQVLIVFFQVGAHDKLGMQVIPLKSLEPHETKSFTLDLVKNMNANDPHNMKQRGKIVVEMTFSPFRQDTERFSGPLDGFHRKASDIRSISVTEETTGSDGAGLLSVTVQSAEDVEGKEHNNPCALVLFRGEMKKTKEFLGHVDINLIDVVNNGCINEKYHLINSRNGIIQLKYDGKQFEVFVGGKKCVY